MNAMPWTQGFTSKSWKKRFRVSPCDVEGREGGKEGGR
jgi:hypothetical protein